MSTLFPIELHKPEGFNYFPDFITSEEETNLLSMIAGLQLHTFMFQGYEANRKTASFGFDWNFERRQLSKGTDVPPMFDSLIARVASQLGLKAQDFVEVLVTEYPPGSVINWHRDAPPFELIAGVSLLSDCIFRFRPHDKVKQTRKSLVSFPLQRRSLYVIAGKARTDWQHSIQAVKQRRYSVTLRTLKGDVSVH